MSNTQRFSVNGSWIFDSEDQSMTKSIEDICNQMNALNTHIASSDSTEPDRVSISRDCAEKQMATRRPQV